jgi:hypothetical protein
MKYGIFVSGCVLLMTAGVFAAESNGNAAWVGVWRGELDGQPSVTLTLAEDTGELGGTVVLGMFGNDNGIVRVIASVPHVLLHPRLEGNTLAFQVKRNTASNELLNFAVTLGSSGKAHIHCLNCGPDTDAPVVELVKAQP